MINWNDDESVVRAAHPNLEMSEARFGWDLYAGTERLSQLDCGAQWNAYKTARLHPSVAALDEAHGKVVEKWPEQK